MKRKYNKRTNSGSMLPVAAGVFAGLIVQLLCCVTVAYLLEKGSVDESFIKTATIVTQVSGIAMTTVISWLMGNDQKLKAATLAGTVVFAVPVMIGLLLWDVNFVSVAISAGLSVVVFGGLVWLLHSVGNRGQWRKRNRRYC